MSPTPTDAHGTNDEKLGFLRNTAFPTSFKVGPNELHVAVGLSKRELFAAMAMQGLCANPERWSVLDESDDDLARFAVAKADALLTALRETP